MIEVKDLTKDYGTRRAIDHLNFTIKKGEVVGFLGPNGAGKSTTMKIITGFMAPSHGQALIAGVDVFENPIEVKRRIGYLPETPPVYLDMYVTDYLRFVASLKGVAKAELNKNVNMAIEKTHLGEVKNRIIGNLSKGFRQRVGIAQALVSNPEILILDEPTVGLDPKQVAEIRELIKELKGQHTIILSTHILPEVEATCERIIIINQGKIVAQDKLSNLSNITKGSRIVNVKVLRNQEMLIGKLRGFTGVLSAKSGSLPSSIDVEVSGTDEILEKLSEFVVKSGSGLVGFESSADLEDVFLKLTYGKDNSSANSQVQA